MSVAPEPSPEPADHPTVPLVRAGATDRCSSCGAHLAVDQRYCVECGERRGRPRFNLTAEKPSTASANSADAAGAGQASSGGSRLRSSSSVVLLTGLLVILIALGVGVLIGHNNNVKPNKAANVTVNEIGSGAGASGSSAPTAPAAVTVNPTHSKGTTAKAAAPKTTKAPSKKVAAAAAATNPNAAATGKAGTAAAAKSFSNTATKKSTLGGSCTPGTTGCSKTGKQTGNLF
jgi:hypothetical protein